MLAHCKRATYSLINLLELYLLLPQLVDDQLQISSRRLHIAKLEEASVQVLFLEADLEYSRISAVRSYYTSTHHTCLFILLIAWRGALWPPRLRRKMSPRRILDLMSASSASRFSTRMRSYSTFSAYASVCCCISGTSFSPLVPARNTLAAMLAYPRAALASQLVDASGVAGHHDHYPGPALRPDCINLFGCDNPHVFVSRPCAGLLRAHSFRLMHVGQGVWAKMCSEVFRSSLCDIF